MGRPPVLPSPRPPAPPRYRHNLRHPLHDIRGREVVDAGDTSLGTVAGQVLENPDQISKYVLERGLDAGTAFEIVSIDIADVDVGRNIGAELQTDQAEAFRNGSIGVMDYYRMENVQADTGMRRSIAQPDSAE